MVVVAPYAGPLRDSTAGRVAVLAPRLWVPDEFGLCRYLAAGLAILQTVDPRLSIDLAALADELDAEVLRNSAGRELFTNPAKTLGRADDRLPGSAGRRQRRDAGAGPARQFDAVADRSPRRGRRRPGRCGDGTARPELGGFADPADALFHDEQIDGPLPARLRVLALTLSAERTVVTARVAGLDDVYLLGAEDVPQLPAANGGVAAAAVPAGAGRAEQQLAVLAVRLEMAAVYLRLARG